LKGSKKRRSGFVAEGLPPSKKRKGTICEASSFSANYLRVRAAQQCLQDAIFQVQGVTLQQGMRECLSLLDEAVLNADKDDDGPNIQWETSVVVPYKPILTATSTLLSFLPRSAAGDRDVVLACMKAINCALSK
jgi:hypothetical protein